MDLLEDARAMSGDLAELRHALHSHPEIGLHLPRTQGVVLSALDGLGMEVSTGSSCSSVTAVLRGTAGAASGGPVVLLRGDMDALPIQEDVDVAFRSQVDGAMHACGHDLHTAMLVGAAHVLASAKDRLTGDVVFMFQPGEEGWDGAGHMIAEGVLDAAGRRPSAAFALHVLSGLTSRGCVASRGGPMMAASDGLFVTVRGSGGHGSSPHLARDPVPAACEMVMALQTALSRSIDAFAPTVLTVGVLQAGTRRNIIPDTATFEATVRTFDAGVRATVAEVAERVCRGVAAAHGVEVDVRYETEYPVTVNDDAKVDFALEVAADLFGAELDAAHADPDRRFRGLLPGGRAGSRGDALPRCVRRRPGPAERAEQPLPEGCVRRPRPVRGCGLYATLAARALAEAAAATAAAG